MFKKFIVSILATLALAFAAVTPASAQSNYGEPSGNGAIQNLSSMPGGQTLVTMKTGATLGGTRPACATYSLRYGIDSTTAGGKAMTAAFQAQYALNRPIEIVGLGTCTVWGDSEDISYIVLF